MTDDQRELESFHQSNLFIVMALNMSWQLAIVVIGPIVGGHYLDEYFKTTPIWTIAGFVAALAGVVGVLVGTVKLANKKTGGGKK